jgi:hypothetical protein
MENTAVLHVMEVIAATFPGQGGSSGSDQPPAFVAGEVARYATHWASKLARELWLDCIHSLNCDNVVLHEIISGIQGDVHRFVGRLQKGLLQYTHASEHALIACMNNTVASQMSINYRGPAAEQPCLLTREFSS